MKKDQILKLLKAQKTALKKFNVQSLSVFGSVARGDMHDESDVDVLVEFKSTPNFDMYMDLKFYLEDLLGRKVDLVTIDALKPKMRPIIEREAIHVT